MTEEITQRDVTVAEHGRDLLNLGRRADISDSHDRDFNIMWSERLAKCNERFGKLEREVTQLSVQNKILMGTIGVTGLGLVAQTVVNWITGGGTP